MQVGFWLHDIVGKLLMSAIFIFLFARRCHNNECRFSWFTSNQTSFNFHTEPAQPWIEPTLFFNAVNKKLDE